MEFTCQKNILLKAIQHTERVISNKTSLPILSNLLFEVNGDILKISATDMEIGVEKKIKITSGEPGAILINSKTVSSIVSKLPDADVSLKVLENQSIEIKCAQSHFNIHGLPAEEFPKISKITDGTNLEINIETLKELIKQTIISVSIDESKHILNGALIEINSDSIIGVATDGYRLSLKNVKGTYNIPERVQIIVPTKALNELMTMLSDDLEGKVNVSYSDSLVSFTVADFYLSTRIIKGQYPDYQQVIPKEYKTVITINKSDFTSSLDRCAVIASSSANIVKLELLDKQLLIQANTPDVGNVNELVDVEINNQEKIHISLNVRLLLEALKIIHTEFITLSLIDSLKPGVIRPFSKDKEADFLYVVMPIRTSENR